MILTKPDRAVYPEGNSTGETMPAIVIRVLPDQR